MFVITASFQVFRGSASDAIIFSLFTALTVLSQTNKPERMMTGEPQYSRKQVLVAVSALAVLLAALPRHTVWYGLMFVALAAFVVITNWTPDSGKKERADKRVNRAKAAWITYGIALCVWELAANILGQLNNTLTEYPTISVLVDPLLDHPLGKAGFVLLWLLTGVGFMRLWRVR